MDLVHAWLEHTHMNAPQQNWPALIYHQPSGIPTPMKHQGLLDTTKRSFARIGGDVTAVSGHSFRRGGCSFAFLAGVKDVLLHRQGDWKSQVYRRYIDLTPAQQCEVSNKMLSFIESGVDYQKVAAVCCSFESQHLSMQQHRTNCIHTHTSNTYDFFSLGVSRGSGTPADQGHCRTDCS